MMLKGQTVPFIVAFHSPSPHKSIKTHAKSTSHNATFPSQSLRKNPQLYDTPDTIHQQPADSPRPDPASPSPLSPPIYHVTKKPEILAPAGGWPQLHAAVENGADAVYFGIQDLNARARANNFSVQELPTVMEYLHTRGVKGYLVLNILIFDDELVKLAQRAQAASRAGVDAVIVQDVGAVAVIKQIAPALPIHGSTQMTITSVEGAQFASEVLGIERIVVGRELSLRDISLISTSSTTSTPPEIEAFVHGALCVSYSGQCFSSEAWGGRSANRGQCAQACRLEYGLLVDNVLQYIGDMKYVLSPQDLSALEVVPELMEAGVVSFKIEGRLKGPEYVAATTRAYRKAVDIAWEARHAHSAGESKHSITAEEVRTLAQVFARGQDAEHRGLTPGFLHGPQHQMLVRGRNPRHRGVYVGEVKQRGSSTTTITRNGGESVGARSVTVRVRLEAPLRRGDGVVLDTGNVGSNGEDVGGCVYDIFLVNVGGGTDAKDKRKAQSVERAEEGSVVDIRIVTTSTKSQMDFDTTQNNNKNATVPVLLWKNKDPEVEAALRSTYASLSSSQRRRIAVQATVTVQGVGIPLRIELGDAQGRKGVAETEAVVEEARGRPSTKADIEKALGVHLGDDEGSSLVMEALHIRGMRLEDAGVFVSAAAIKEARRRAVRELVEQQAMRRQRQNETGIEKEILVLKNAEDVVEGMKESILEAGRRQVLPSPPPTPSEVNQTAQRMIRILCRTKAQVDAAIQVPWLKDIILDFLEVHGLKEAVAAVKASGKRCTVASPRIFKPDERRLWVFYLKLGADALLVRSAGFLHQLMMVGGPGSKTQDGLDIPVLEGDFSLNVSNVVSADLFLRRSSGSALSGGGLSRLAPTHDCHADQLAGIARGLGPARASRLEAIIHQNLPIFHTEHCVFARFLSEGNSFLDCGHPCEHHTVHIRAPDGKDHLVLADMGCRNTVFDGTAQSGLGFIDRLVASGYGCFRIELVDQKPSVVAPLLEGYKNAIEHALQHAPRDVGLAQNKALWAWMDTELTDANGRAHGVGMGSLQPRVEREKKVMKMTAAAKKGQLLQSPSLATTKKNEKNKKGGHQ